MTTHVFTIPASDDFDHEFRIGFDGSTHLMTTFEFDFRNVVMLDDWEPVARLVAERLDYDPDALILRLKECIRAEYLVYCAYCAGEFDWAQVGYGAGVHLDPGAKPPSFLDIYDAIRRNGNAAVRARLIKSRRREFQRSRDHLALALLDAGHDYVCAVCATDDDLTVDHIEPLSRGGSDELSNLRFLCRPCNSKKGAKRLELVT